uniref:Spastin n=1 Tax=Triticum urartu TaxID=4572 RepID=A0A8R7QDL8_TRIUA
MPSEALVHSGRLKCADNVKRGRGRPNLTWEESVKRYLKDGNITKELPMDRGAWKIGEGEKLVRALFGVACCRQPAVIFVDEIDSLLSQRKSDGEHESSRRLKTQFLIEMEGFDSGNEQILLIGATNRPQELDEAARRRLTKRLYIPLPSSEARTWIIRNLLEKDGLFKLSEKETGVICKLTEGYSGSDMKNLVKDASMGPLREALQQGVEITKLNKEEVRPVMLKDFEAALQEVRPSVSTSELGIYEEWNMQFGSLSI